MGGTPPPPLRTMSPIKALFFPRAFPKACMLQDLCWHHRMCRFAHHPHPNVLPAMPTSKKTGKLAGMIVKNGDVGVGPTL